MCFVKLSLLQTSILSIYVLTTSISPISLSTLAWKIYPESHMPTGIDGNYRVITLIFTKYSNLPLCLDNYALFLLLPIFTNNLYTYKLRYIIYLGEPSGNIISNYHGTFIHIFMHGYDPNLNIYKY